jgi:hypothetical protein
MRVSSHLLRKITQLRKTRLQSTERVEIQFSSVEDDVQASIRACGGVISRFR